MLMTVFAEGPLDLAVLRFDIHDWTNTHRRAF